MNPSAVAAAVARHQVNYFAQETAIIYGSLNADNSTKELGLGYQLLDDVLRDLSQFAMPISNETCLFI